MLVARIFGKGPVRHHSSMNLSVQQIVLRKFDEELGLGQRVNRFRRSRHQQFLVPRLHPCHSREHSTGPTAGIYDLLPIVGHKVGLRDLVDSLQEVYRMRLHIY